MAETNLVTRGNPRAVGADQRSLSDASEPDGPEREACTACASVRVHRARLPCGHWWCRRCLRRLVREALGEDGRTWPPRCCVGAGAVGAVPEGLVRWVRDRAVFLAYRARARMMRVPVGERTYCHAAGCGAFIDPERYVTVAVAGVAAEEQPGDYVAGCPRPGCGAETCVGCGRGAHPGRECLPAEDLAELVVTAVANRWQACRACGRFVERTEGCHEMRCRCGRSFCYICGGPLPCANARAGRENALTDEQRRQFITRNIVLSQQARQRAAQERQRRARPQPPMAEAPQPPAEAPAPAAPPPQQIQQPQLRRNTLMELQLQIQLEEHQLMLQERRDQLDRLRGTGRHAATGEDADLARRLAAQEEETRATQARWAEEARRRDEGLARREEAAWEQEYARGQARWEMDLERERRREEEAGRAAEGRRLVGLLAEVVALEERLVRAAERRRALAEEEGRG